MGGSLDMCVLGFASVIWMDARHLHFFVISVVVRHSGFEKFTG
jgi:hypothetical protein